MKKLVYITFAIVTIFASTGCKKLDNTIQKKTDSTAVNGPSIETIAGLSLNNIKGVIYDNKTTNVFVANTLDNNIARISTGTGYAISIFAGNGGHGQGSSDGISATFFSPSDLCVDSKGIIYVADFGNNLIRKIHPDTLTITTTSTIAGNGKFDDIDGIGIQASFKGPTGIAIDSQGNLYVSESASHLIRKIAPTGTVTTFAGTGKSGSNNAVGVLASFNQPTGLAIDANNNLYVADMGNNEIRKITPDGTVTTIAGTGASGSTNDITTKATFNNPTGLAFDLAGNLIVADQNNNMIRKISTSGLVTTIAGNGSVGSTNGLALQSTFNKPYDVTVDAKGNIYVSDTGNSLLRKITIN